MGKEELVDLDKILVDLGQFGRYQVITYCYILVPILFSAVYNSQYIFTAGDLQYRCSVPQCESSPPQLNPDWAVWALPASDSRCQRLRPIGEGCTPSDFHPNKTESCSSWVYEHQNSIVAEFDLACQSWKRTMVGTVHSIGLFAALPLTSYISDTFGRRTAFILTATSPAVMGVIRSFSTNYIMLLVFEFLDPTFGSGVYSTGFILALEMVGLNKRVLGGNLVSCTFALGQVCLALVAWGIPNWRTLTRVLYAPSILFILYYFVIEESVRWLLSKGNKREAARIIYKAAEVNKKKLSPESIKMLSETNVPSDAKLTIHELPSTNPVDKKEQSVFMMVLRSKIMIARLAICSFWWITVTFIYYGLSINSVSLAGNSYVNYILTSLVEIPGYSISVITLDRFGRKRSIMTAFFICGLSLIAMPFVPSHLIWLQTSLSMLGKLCISSAFSSIYIYTSELFPTETRHRCIGFCSMIGRIGSIVAPQTPLLMVLMESLPYLIFGVMAFISGLLMLLTPETLHMRLPDTVKEAETMAASPRTKGPPDVIVD